MGDVNCNMASMSDTNSRLLSDITDLFSLHQLINELTRVTDTTSILTDGEGKRRKEFAEWHVVWLAE